MNKVEVAISQDKATWIFKWWNGILVLMAHTVKTDAEEVRHGKRSFGEIEFL